MLVLGISAYHGDSSAAVVRDGEIVAAVEEERFTRQKHWAGFPARAIRYCLEEAGATLDSLDAIAVSRDPKAQVWRKIAFVLTSSMPWRIVLERLSKHRRLLGVDSLLAEKFGVPVDGIRPKIRRVEHHLAHVAGSFHAGPFTEAALLSVDAFGDFTSTLMGKGANGRVETMRRVFFPHSLGVLYTAVTQFLGFPYYGDEYKVMGLAPYGRPVYREAMNELISVSEDGTFKLNLKYFRHHKDRAEMSWRAGTPEVGKLFSDDMAELFGESRELKAPLEQRHKDIAASVQACYEDVFVHILSVLHQQTGCRNLCVSGGCAMNSVANGKIFDRSPFTQVYIPPQPGDGGGALGAALQVIAEASSKNPWMPGLHSAFLGPAFSAEDIQAMLEERLASETETFEITTVDEEELCRSVARDISEGKVVGWFQGRMEWGPRALGNRSILADPRRADMKDILNLKIKRRESFRPFAPSILKEHTAEYFETDYDVPYMSMVFQIRSEKREVIPAVTHVNGSGRLQTVTRRDNPLYWKLILAFGDITGVPIVLNTSFNENEPIVCTPAEALECFLRTKMDTLALGRTVLRRNGDAPPAA
ncbi:MAG: carbamoyltransferase [Phycisphaerae bacterium]|nr:carbamoyltransferase [Phycisphaerae bacterium]